MQEEVLSKEKRRMQSKVCARVCVIAILLLTCNFILNDPRKICNILSNKISVSVCFSETHITHPHLHNTSSIATALLRGKTRGLLSEKHSNYNDTKKSQWPASKQNEHILWQGDQEPVDIRILIFFTTFPKAQHLDFLRDCWPGQLSRVKILRRADILVFLGGPATANVVADWSLAVKKLAKNATLHHDPMNPGYQSGAMRAMHQFVKNGWGNDYDWMIRINPDVLIYDGAYLESFFFDRELSAVFASCQHILVRPRSMSEWVRPGSVHTDFFAVRPHKIPTNAFADWKTSPNAEDQATRVFWEIISKKECAWLLPLNIDGACRVRGE